MADAIELITSDHREVERLFEQMQSRKDDRATLAEEVAHMLIAHSRAEEEQVYPVIAREAPDEEDQVQHGEEEHQQAERLARTLKDTDPGSEEFDRVLEQLVEAVTHHVETEENEVLPALREAVDDKRLNELGDAFWRKRQEVLTGLESGGDIGDMTREELYEKAKEADVPGRSGMKKDELVEALREQDQGGR
ncbi:hypothetical protein GCM10027168_14630 [Streptomyces capparidis]